MKKYIKTAILSLLIVSFSLAFISCGEQKGEMKIGLILPLTGSLAFMGNPEKNGFELKLILDSIRLMLGSAWVTLLFCMSISFLIH